MKSMKKSLMALCLSLLLAMSIGSVSVFAQDLNENSEEQVYSAIIGGVNENSLIQPALSATWWTIGYSSPVWTHLGTDTNLLTQNVTVTLKNLSAVNSGEPIPTSVKIAIFKKDGTKIANTITLYKSGDYDVIGPIPVLSGEWTMMAQVVGASKGSVTISVKD